MWESRVLRRAFERLELHEGKLSRAVLRGGGGGDVTSLPDPGWATTQVYPARGYPRSPGRAPLLRSALSVVTPAHISGAASGAGSCAGTRARAVAGVTR